MFVRAPNKAFERDWLKRWRALLPAPQGKRQATRVRSVKTNEQDEMIGLFEFAKIKGIDTAKVVEIIRDGYYVGKKVGDDWFVSRSELYSEPVENQEYVTSLIKKLALTKKLALIEMIVIVFYIVLTFNSEMAGIAYLF